jgi:hypothetical protein
MLDFTLERDDETYVILNKDNLTVHILRAGQDIGEMEFYMVVDDVDKVWNNMKNNLDGIKVKPPFNQEYGMKEVHVIIPETKTLMFIGQAIKDRH